MKNYIAENFAEHLKKINFPNYKTYSCLNMVYLDFTTKFIDSLCPLKKIRIKGNTKYWFNLELQQSINVMRVTKSLSSQGWKEIKIF